MLQPPISLFRYNRFIPALTYVGYYLLLSLPSSHTFKTPQYIHTLISTIQVPLRRKTNGYLSRPYCPHNTQRSACVSPGIISCNTATSDRLSRPSDLSSYRDLPSYYADARGHNPTATSNSRSRADVRLGPRSLLKEGKENTWGTP